MLYMHVYVPKSVCVNMHGVVGAVVSDRLAGT